MNQGIEILLERIKTHPEEFVTGSKWDFLIDAYKQWLPQEDMQAYRNAVGALMMQDFTEQVLKKITKTEPQYEQSPIHKIQADGLKALKKAYLMDSGK